VAGAHQSWCLLSKLTGYVSLGHVVFYGLGAYLVVVTWQSWPLPLAIAAAGALAALFAALIGLPVLRVRGPYFVILTFGIAELVKYSILAAEAASGTASRILFGAPDLIVIYFAMFALAAAATLLLVVVGRSRFGHGLRSLRENEEAAETLGVPVVRYKLLAFVLSAAIPGMVGAVMALRSTYFVVGQVFDPMISVTVIAMALLGGGDDTRGPILGTLFLFIVSEVLWIRAPLAYMLILGAVLAGFVLVAPGRHLGLARQSPRPRRERRMNDADSAPLLEVRDLGKRFGGLTALSGVSFSVAAGETVGIMGANGAGKTTLFSLIAGNARPSAGTIAFAGGRIDGLSPDRICRLGIARTFQIVKPFPGLTVLENLRTAAMFGRAGLRDRREGRRRGDGGARGGRHGRPGIGASGDAHPRRAEAPRGRARHRHRRPPRPPRRGDGRPDRDRGGADARHPAPRARCAPADPDRHRARDAGADEALRPHRRPAPRRAHRRGHAGSDRQRPARALRLLRNGGMSGPACTFRRGRSPAVRRDRARSAGAAMTEPLLRIESLAGGYGATRILHGLDLSRRQRRRHRPARRQRRRQDDADEDARPACCPRAAGASSSAARRSPAATPPSGCSPASCSCPKAGSSFPT
jgi:branched-chain amino acid transport system permease protein